MSSSKNWASTAAIPSSASDAAAGRSDGGESPPPPPGLPLAGAFCRLLSTFFSCLYLQEERGRVDGVAQGAQGASRRSRLPPVQRRRPTGMAGRVVMFPGRRQQQGLGPLAHRMKRPWNSAGLSRSRPRRYCANFMAAYFRSSRQPLPPPPQAAVAPGPPPRGAQSGLPAPTGLCFTSRERAASDPQTRSAPQGGAAARPLRQGRRSGCAAAGDVPPQSAASGDAAPGGLWIAQGQRLDRTQRHHGSR